MKYIVITSKHHDGFAMYDSTVSDYDIVDRTPYKKDPIAAARRRDEESRAEVLLLLLDHGLAPPVAVRRTRRARTAPPGNGKNQILPEQKPVYVTYMKAQLKELVTKYDPAVLVVRRRVDRLVDRGRRPGSLRLRARPQAVDHHQQSRRQGPQGHGGAEPGRTANTRATSARPSSRSRPTAFPASTGKAA